VLRQVGWASVPIWSIGFLSFVPFLAFALMQRKGRDWAVFGVYLALTAAMIVTVGAAGSGAGGAAAGGFLIALAGCAAVHAGVLFRPSRSLAPAAQPPGAQPPGAQPAALSPQQRNRDAIRQARDRLERRKEARHLAQTNPALARDLRIGRPDVPREYDDGGLVDVNEVPGAVLAAQLGLTPHEVTQVLAARDKLGGKFASADELCAYTELSPDRVDELRDLMIFS